MPDPGLKNGISVRELISTLKKKNAGGEWIVAEYTVDIPKSCDDSCIEWWSYT